MKKFFSYSLAFVTLMLLLSACGGSNANDLLSEIEERGTIRISTDANYAPHSYLDENDNFIGFDIDVATEIANRLGVEVQFVTPEWDLVTSGSWNGAWDMSVGSMTITIERQELLDFAEPAYYFTPAQFAAADGVGIDSLDDIIGQSVCVGLSTTYETWLSGDVTALGLPDSSLYATPPAGITIVPLQTDNDCFQSIQSGRGDFDVFLASNTVVQTAIDGGVRVVRVGMPVFSENLAVAFDKSSELENAALVARVSEIIAEMHKDGTLTELSFEWFDEDLTQNPTQ